MSLQKLNSSEEWDRSEQGRPPDDCLSGEAQEAFKRSLSTDNASSQAERRGIARVDRGQNHLSWSSIGLMLMTVFN